MILPCEVPQLDNPDVARNRILQFFLVSVQKIISVQEIFSDSLFEVGEATRRAQKRESCSPPWRPCRGLSYSNPIPLDRTQKVGPETYVTQPCMFIIS